MTTEHEAHEAEGVVMGRGADGAPERRGLLMSLFPLEPLPPTPEPISEDRRRTIRRQALLESGVHPATHEPLLHEEWGFTCGDCAHHVAYRQHRPNSGAWHKCLVGRLGPSASAASDIRISWPACRRYRLEGDR